MNNNTVKQVLVAALGGLFTAVVIGGWGWVSEGRFIQFIGGITEASLPASPTIVQVKKEQLRVKEVIAELRDKDREESVRKAQLRMKEVIAELRGKDRVILDESVEPPGATPWGRWHSPAYCPQNFYVCGVQQKVESVQGGNRDDTAVNSIRLRCCQLFPTLSP